MNFYQIINDMLYTFHTNKDKNVWYHNLGGPTGSAKTNSLVLTHIVNDKNNDFSQVFNDQASSFQWPIQTVKTWLIH